MNTKVILDFILLILPVAMVCITILYIYNRYETNVIFKNAYKLQSENNDNTKAFRLQAQERLILYLERINPYAMIPKLRETDQSGVELQFALIHQIRNEFEHNIAQQLYVSKNTWELIKATKEHVVSIINNAASRLPANASALDLTKQIFEILQQMQVENPSEAAIDAIKNEAWQPN